MGQLILVADDEANIRELVRYNLELAGFDVIEASNGEETISKALQDKPDLIILDIMMPVVDGLKTCRRLKENKATSAIPVMMLTARSGEEDKVLGLDIGADDYIVKPFGVRELTARVKALLRRTSLPEDQTRELSFGRLVLDTSKYRAKLDGRALELTLKEYELLKYLMMNAEQVLTREVLLEKIWGYDYMGETRTVDVHIRHLRAKLGDMQDRIETVRGVGYRFIATDGE